MSREKNVRTFNPVNFVRAGEIVTIPIARIKYLPNQPRSFFKRQSLQELGESIQATGQLTPILVAPLTGDPLYDWLLIEGERRCRGSLMVGLTNIEAIVRTVSDESQHRALAAVANFCREELTPLEEAAAVQMLKDERKMSNAEIAKNVGKSIGWVTQRVTLLKLPLEVKALMDPTKPESEQLRFSAALLLADLPEQMAVKAAKHLVTHKLIGVAATTYIQRTAQEQAGKQARRRRPRDTMQSLRRAVVGLNEVVDFVGGMNRKDFSNLLRTRPEDEVKDTEAAVVECIANLENILVELKQAHSTDVVKVGGVNA